MLSDTTIRDALRHVQDPELHRDIVSLDMVRDVRIDGTAVALTVDLTTPACPLKDEIGRDIEAAIRGLGATEVDLTWGATVRRAREESRPSGQRCWWMSVRRTVTPQRIHD